MRSAHFGLRLEHLRGILGNAVNAVIGMVPQQSTGLVIKPCTFTNSMLRCSDVQKCLLFDALCQFFNARIEAGLQHGAQQSETGIQRSQRGRRTDVFGNEIGHGRNGEKVGRDSRSAGHSRCCIKLITI